MTELSRLDESIVGEVIAGVQRAHEVGAVHMCYPDCPRSDAVLLRLRELGVRAVYDVTRGDLHFALR